MILEDGGGADACVFYFKGKLLTRIRKKRIFFLLVECYILLYIYFLEEETTNRVNCANKCMSNVR